MPELLSPIDPDIVEIKVKAMKVRQPVGDMFIASVPHNVITKIAHFDVRRIVRESRDVESYLGIQRPLNLKRVEEISTYVNFSDASFPSSIIVSIDESYVSFDDRGNLSLRNYRVGENAPSIAIRDLARVLDGQHRIAGLEKFRGDAFEVIVTIFVGADISDQAYIFATVNLEQQKVSKSLAYDLFSLARSRSPQKTCHNIAVAFDQDSSGPFYKRIKRLGSATPGRDFETVSQATFVDGIIGYVSVTPKVDRDLLLRGRTLADPTSKEIQRSIFRRMFVEERDLDIAKTLHEYFSAVRDRWPRAWNSDALGYMLNRTNGYRALCRLLRPMYLYHSMGDEVVTRAQFMKFFGRVEMTDEDFTTDSFPPGTSGEAALFNRLMQETGLEAVNLELGF